MSGGIYRYDADIHRGTIRDRPNRFLLTVELNGTTEDVYLSNPGALSTVYGRGREVLCIPAASADRKTDFTAIAINTTSVLVLVHTILANDLFEAAIATNRLPGFEPGIAITREPALPDHGRADFKLNGPGGEEYVEVKACTHVEDGVGKFPDRPTKRGRRHLQSLQTLAEAGTTCHVVFVGMRPDIEVFEPYHDIDPDFATLLQTATDAGVNTHMFTTEFTVPTVQIHDSSIPIRFHSPTNTN